MVCVTNGKRKESVREKTIALGRTLTLLLTRAARLAHGPMAGNPPLKERARTKAKAKVTKAKAKVTKEKAKTRTKVKVRREADPQPEEVTLHTLEPECPRLERQTGILAKPILQESVTGEPNVTVGIPQFVPIGARGLVLKAKTAPFFIKKNRKSLNELTLRRLRSLKQRQKAKAKQRR